MAGFLLRVSRQHDQEGGQKWARNGNTKRGNLRTGTLIALEGSQEAHLPHPPHPGQPCQLPKVL